ncbi:hypothetical protein Csp2054_01110 [Curtobacterium sp. 'Ferrero']|uniref:hypothetical protein n=1 Tax=Curtobacterium sp. 'Ferrero' TaxID=2033654 RepID=UPI000BC82FA2|nr:hypothetical protein [Curtobacterium sp. 'Ferrero']PCN49577.1 hypothetical protein Csp2054_01110 [Curtobacterium sp. 'Ferrero']
MPHRTAARPFRHARHVRARLRRVRRRLEARLVRFSGWVWVAAVSLVGIEVFEVVFGTFVLAPEFLPVALIVMALAYVFRERLRRVRRRVVVCLRSRRARR